MAARKKGAAKKAPVRRRKTKKKTGAVKRPAARKPAAPKKKAAPRARKRPAAPVLPTTWGLALQGAWRRGAFLAGALDALHRTEKLPEFSIIAGTGSGALVAALAATGRWTEMRELFLGLDRRQLLRPRFAWLPGGRAATFLLSMLDRTQSLFLTHKDLEPLVHRVVDANALRAAPCEVHFVATDLQTGALRTFHNRHDSAEDLLAAVVAASTRPVFMPLVRAGSARHQHADGALRGFAPLRVIFRELARETAPGVARVLAVSTLGPAESHRLDSYRDIAEVLDRTAGLASSQLGAADVSGAGLVNALLAVRVQLGEKRFATLLQGLDAATRAEVERHLAKRYVPVVHLHPEAPAAAGALECEAAASRAAFEAGAVAAERAFA